MNAVQQAAVAVIIVLEASIDPRRWGLQVHGCGAVALGMIGVRPSASRGTGVIKNTIN